MPIGSLITKHILHFALLCLWDSIIHVKIRPIWPYSSQPQQNKKWIIQFHTKGRAKLKKCFVIGEPMGISGEIQGQKVFLDAVYCNPGDSHISTPDHWCYPPKSHHFGFILLIYVLINISSTDITK